MKTATVQIHRFRDEVAIAVCNVGGETVYLSPADALAIAKSMRAAAMSCKREAFSAAPSFNLSCPARRLGEPRKGE